MSISLLLSSKKWSFLQETEYKKKGSILLLLRFNFAIFACQKMTILIKKKKQQLATLSSKHGGVIKKNILQKADEIALNKDKLF